MALSAAAQGLKQGDQLQLAVAAGLAHDVLEVGARRVPADALGGGKFLDGFAVGQQQRQACLGWRQAEDVARQTLEMNDRYVILPSWGTLRAEYAAAGAREVADGFCYASDQNTEALDARGLQTLLAGAFP